MSSEATKETSMQIKTTESGIRVEFENGAYVSYVRNSEGLLVFSASGGAGVSSENLSALYANQHALAQYLCRTSGMKLAFALA